MSDAEENLFRRLYAMTPSELVEDRMSVWARLRSWLRKPCTARRPALWECPQTGERCTTILTCEYVCRIAFLAPEVTDGTP